VLLCEGRVSDSRAGAIGGAVSGIALTDRTLKEATSGVASSSEVTRAGSEGAVRSADAVGSAIGAFRDSRAVVSAVASNGTEHLASAIHSPVAAGAVVQKLSGDVPVMGAVSSSAVGAISGNVVDELLELSSAINCDQQVLGNDWGIFLKGLNLSTNQS